jgi:hypothetical protein
MSASLALAEDFKTVKGKEYKNATVRRVEPDGIVLLTKSGISKIYFVELPKEVQERFHYVDPAKAAAERAAAIDKKRADERAEKERIAQAILAKTEEQFAVAEIQAAHAYESTQKGILSGQIFVVTNGRENIKLGAQRVALFPYDGVNTLLDALHQFADAKSDELQVDISAAEDEEKQAKLAEEEAQVAAKQAEAAAEQADKTERTNQALYKRGIGLSDGLTTISAAREAGIAARRDLDAAKEAENRARDRANAARDKIGALSEEKAYYDSDAFVFSHLQSPIQIGETDAEGKFRIQVPRTGKWIIAAHAQRMTLKRIEYYYWLQPVALNDQHELVQNLSINNMSGRFLSDRLR